jgi:two-component system phosphate regulon sensor histidine kinase PhoR
MSNNMPFHRMLKRLLLSYFLVILVFLIVIDRMTGIPIHNPVIMVVVSLFMALSVILVTRHFYVRPILMMNEMTERIAKGDFSRRVNVYFGNELGDLVRNLNEMSDVLQEKINRVTHDKNELQAILSSLVEGVVVIGSDERVLYVSPNFADLLDVRSREATGRSYWEVLRNQEINDSIKEAIDQNKALKKEIDIIGPKDACFSMQISPVLSEDGKLMSVAAIFHDITELKRFERMRTEFVANVSHELKTPLTSIKGFVETLQGGAFKEPETARRFLDIISKHADRLETLVDDLLTISSLESKELAMDLEKENVGNILQSVVGLSRPQIERFHHRLEVDIPDDLPPVKADRRRIEQVFLNLLDNAVKFTPQGGKIAVSARAEDGFVRIDVRDNGIGIESEHIPRLFERFYRVDKARSRELGGTGLGLAIVKHIILAHNGKIAVASKMQEGSTFSVFLPADIS